MPTIVSSKLKELESARAKLASLEQAVQAELKKELAALPAKFGFESADDFVQAVREATGARGRGRGRPPSNAGGPGKKRRHRAVITDETRALVKKLVEAGKTGAQIAKEVGISLPSVQNVKKALGLVKNR